MEDFEYSVEICDRDWECFFAECEECNLLPPSLAGVDDSGMSDIDDTGSIHLKKVQKYNLTAGFSRAEHPIDGPPDCEGSPVEDYLSKYGVSGMESVLSGSEEDIHLQSVNIFFERLKNVTEAERLAEPNQVRAGENREAIKEEEQYSDGQQSSSSMPKNIPKLNSLPARGETAVGKETMMPVDSIRNINTMKKIKPGSNVSPEAASSNSILKTNKSTYPETELFIREEACTDVNEVTQQNLSHDSLDRVVCSQTPLHTDEVMQVEMYSPLKDVQLTSQPPLSDKCNTNSSSNLKMTNGQWKEEQNPAVLQLDATCIIKSASQESSPSASVKRKRRRRRRLSFEPSDSSHGYERQVLAQQSDSEEGQYAGKGGTSLCLSEDVDLLHLNEPHKNIVSSLYSVASNLPLRISRKQMKANDLSHTVPPCQYLPESITSSAENNATITALGQIDDGVMSAADNSGNMLINLQPCTRLEVEELTRLNKYPWLSVSVSATLTGQSDLNGETANGEVNQSITGGGSEQNLKCCTAEVKSISHRITSSMESNDRSVDFRQNDKLFTAKAVLAVEAGNAGRDSHTPCQRKAEPQEQLEIDCHDTDQYSSTLEKTCGLNTKPQEFKTKAFPLLEETSYKETCAKFTSDCISSSPDERCLCKRPPSLDMNNTEQQTEDPLEIQTLSKLDILSGEKTQLAVSQLMASVCQTGEINSTGSSQRETKLSMSEDSITNPSDIRPLSSCCTLDTESVRLLSNGFITDLSGSQNESVSQGEKITQILAKHEEGDAKSAFKSHFITNDLTESKFDVLGGEEDAVTSSKAEHTPKKAPDSKRSVFAMSSFWSEMEKLTINDILHLRTSKAAPPISPSPVPESEEINMFAATDSGFFTQLNESNSVQTDDDISSLPDFVESSLGCVKPLDSSSGVMWESEPVPVSHDLSIYPENMMLTHESHISQPFVSGRSQKSLRKISKNVSVQNLHALESESFNSTWRGQTLQTLDEGESEKAEYFSDEHMPKQDKDMDSLLKDSYKISVMDIFQYFFGGKQSIPSQSATDNTTTFYTDGNSLPETYDHFFSEFDTESFFSPFNTAEDQTKDKLVPIFSYSRSANRNLQFPEAYDYFFESSSTDDSSVESDGEDDCSPVRVVTRFSRKSSASQISTDIYDNFFTDNDLRQNFFWKTMLSFRNINFAGSAVQKQCLSRSLSQVNVRPSGRSLRRTVYPSNVLGNQDVIFPDPLLYHLEDRMLRQQAQHPLRYEDLQTAVSNPRLDASLLPLRQSDMCLVCIAFASWVLKTANPQVGDAWKAVLLANVSALSAIRYLRKYVKMETAAGEKKPNGSTPSES